ncbi:mis18-binding protein 1-like [Physella acuta]|uniref:mis18-binding protein 1-like n=1 Tax=Physella acuta TaxID=109671 RepID=UPI0027DCAC7D|nr:mis18-binding protein 1-like [Physella acuta]
MSSPNHRSSNCSTNQDISLAFDRLFSSVSPIPRPYFGVGFQNEFRHFLTTTSKIHFTPPDQLNQSWDADAVDRNLRIENTHTMMQALKMRAAGLKNGTTKSGTAGQILPSPLTINREKETEVKNDVSVVTKAGVRKSPRNLKNESAKDEDKPKETPILKTVKHKENNKNKQIKTREDNASKLKTREDSASKLNTREDNASKLNTREDKTSKLNTREDKASKLNTREENSSKLKSKEDNSSELKTREGNTSKLKTKEDNFSMAKSKEDNSSKLKTREGNTSKLKTKEDNFSMAKSKEDNSSKLKTRENNSSVLESKESNSSKLKTREDNSSKLKTKEDTTISIQEIVLRDWIIRPLPVCRGLCVEGQKLGREDFWHSTAIAEAKTAKVVVTVSGSVYKLKGKINKLCTIDNGFPESIAKAFSKGFPPNWKELIKEYYADLEESISIIENETPKRVKAKRGRKPKLKAPQEKKEDPNTTTSSIWTPGGLIQQEIHANNVTITRSGRMSLPPLARWVGQHYSRAPGSDKIQVSFETEVAKETLTQYTNHVMNLPVKDQKLFLSRGVLSPNITQLAASNSSKKPKTAKKSGLDDTAGEKKSDKDTKENKNFDNTYTKLTKTGKISDVVDSKADEKDQSSTQDPSATQTPGLLRSTRKRKIVQMTDFETVSPKKTTSLRKPGRKKAKLSEFDDLNEKPANNLLTRTRQGKHKQDEINISETKQKSSSKQKNRTKTSPPDSSLCNTDLNDSLSSDFEVSDPKLKVKKGQKKTKTVKNKKKGSGSESASVSDTPTPQVCDTTFSKVSDTSGSKTNDTFRTNNKAISAPKTSAAPTSKSVAKQQKSSVSPSHLVAQTAVPSKEKQKRSYTKKANVDTKSKKRKLADTTTSDCEKSKKTKISNEIDDSNGEKWSPHEEEVFFKALKTITSDLPDYWQKVAKVVGTRSEVECQQFHKLWLEEKSKNKQNKHSTKRTKSTSRQKGEPIRGGKGTLKRKQEIRAFLDEQNEGYEDDLFTSSPFVARQKLLSTAVDFNKNDSEVFGANHNFFTPVSGSRAQGTPGVRIRAAMASAKKTPISSAAIDETPISANSRRNQADRYIKHFIDRKKKTKKSKSLDQEVVQKEFKDNLELSVLPVKSLFSPVTNPSILIDGADDDDDEDNKDMYYWDDDD